MLKFSDVMTAEHNSRMNSIVKNHFKQTLFKKCFIITKHPQDTTRNIVKPYMMFSSHPSVDDCLCAEKIRQQCFIEHMNDCWIDAIMGYANPEFTDKFRKLDF
tara:strand:+ start:3857 stop:4165 length:309 start_codon:yes stop_codon:yes gene_type:complete